MRKMEVKKMQTIQVNCGKSQKKYLTMQVKHLIMLLFSTFEVTPRKNKNLKRGKNQLSKNRSKSIFRNKDRAKSIVKTEIQNK